MKNVLATQENNVANCGLAHPAKGRGMCGTHDLFRATNAANTRTPGDYN